MTQKAIRIEHNKNTTEFYKFLLTEKQNYKKVLNPKEELYKLQEPKLDQEILDTVDELNKEAEEGEGRNLAELILEAKKGIKANLVIAQAEALSKVTCYKDDNCVGDLYVEIRPGVTIKLYHREIPNSGFVSRL